MMRITVAVLTLVAASIGTTAALQWAGDHTVDLTALPWTLTTPTATNASAIGTVPARVPADVYSALHAAGRIPNPLAGAELQALRWVAETNWTFSATVPAADVGRLCVTASSGAGAITLHIGALEAVARVRVNGVIVASTVTTFLPIEASVASVVCDFDPADGLTLPATIAIEFTSTIGYAAHQASMYGAMNVGALPDAPAYPFGFPHRNFVRTSQASFGWDWGPAVAPSSVRGPVELSAALPCHPTAVIASVRMLSCREPLSTADHGFSVSFNVSFALPRLCSATDARVQLVDSGGAALIEPQFRDNASADGGQRRSSSGSTTARFTEPSAAYTVRREWAAGTWTFSSTVSRWWPKGLGQPTTYRMTLRVDIVGRDGFTVATRAVPVTVGFRCVALQVSDRSMQFRVNGVPVFAKGANVVPPSLFFTINSPGQASSSTLADRLEDLVNVATGAHMNMLRVWGGGEYLPDSFYEACTAHGIMVWQEMMFACAEYPVDETFLQLVKREVDFQVRRLSRHPSVVLWSGNNEDGEVYDTGPDSAYQRLNTDTVLAAIVAADDTRPIWPSSPSPGFASGVDPKTGLPSGSIADPVPVVTLPTSLTSLRGDTHFYNYTACGHGTWPQTAFASEYGYEGMPSVAAMNASSYSAGTSGRSMNSSWMHFRQRHAGGNAEMVQLVEQVLGLPPGVTPEQLLLPPGVSTDAFSAFAYLSQVQQAHCVEEETAWYRRQRRAAAGGGPLTMGALFWQLNDVWAAPTWAAVEASGGFRLMMTRIASAFHPLSLSVASPSFTTDASSGAVTMEVDISNDFPFDASGVVTADCVLADRVAFSCGRQPVAVPAGAGLRVNMTCAGFLAPTSELLAIRLRWRTSALSGSNDVSHSNSDSPEFTWFPLGVKRATVRLSAGPDCRVTVAASALKKHVLRVCCQRTALFVAVSTASTSPRRNGRFFPNGLDILAGECRLITYTAFGDRDDDSQHLSDSDFTLTSTNSVLGQ